MVHNYLTSYFQPIFNILTGRERGRVSSSLHPILWKDVPLRWNTCSLAPHAPSFTVLPIPWSGEVRLKNSSSAKLFLTMKSGSSETVMWPVLYTWDTMMWQSGARETVKHSGRSVCNLKYWVIRFLKTFFYQLLFLKSLLIPN